MKRLPLVLLLVIVTVPFFLGTVSSAFGVKLGWNKNTETNLRGYKLYRGPVKGGPYTETKDVGMGTSTPEGVEADWDAPEGSKLYYAVTAYGECFGCPPEKPNCLESEKVNYICESGYSNEVYFPSYPRQPQNLVPK